MANTTETLLLGDLETLKLSEIPWQARGGSGSAGGGLGGAGGSDAAAEKFIFDSPSAALVYHASELSIVEYGRNEVCIVPPCTINKMMLSFFLFFFFLYANTNPTMAIIPPNWCD